MTQVPWWPVRQRDRASAEPISAELVVTAALELLRSGGIAALTMRKVAAELGVSVSTVYWWAGSRDQLLALVADEVHGNVALPVADPSVPWTEQLREYAEHTYAVYVAHPFVVPIIVGGVLSGPHTLDLVECGLAILERAGLAPAEAVAAHSALAALVVGFLRPVPGAEDRDDAWTSGHRLEELDPERYPAIVAGAQELHAADRRAHFELALDVFLLGLAARAGRSTEPEGTTSPA